MLGTPTFLPTPDEARAVIPIAAALQSTTGETEPILLLPNGQRQTIPAPLANVLALAAQAMMSGCAVSITIHNGTLTTKQAADMLACSRQHVVKLIDEGKLKAEKVPGGTHRRIRLKNLLAFMKQEDISRDNLMKETALITEEQGGYDEFHDWNKARKSK